MNPEVRNQIINLLIENEVAMRDLYIIYSEKFPLYKRFWTNISKDEESHAAWVETLHKKIKAGMVEFSEQRFRTDAIKENIEFIRKLKADSETATYLGALESSVHLEKGMLENKLFEVFEKDSIELKIILEALRLGTQNHFQEIERVWKKEKMGSSFEAQTK